MGAMRLLLLSLAAFAAVSAGAEEQSRESAKGAEARIVEARGRLGDDVVWALQVSPPAAAQVLIVSPAPTLWGVRQKRSTGGLPLLPYSMMVANAYTQSVFALLLGDFSILAANLSGLVFGAIFCGVWLKYAQRRSDGHRPLLGAGVMMVVVTLIAGTLHRTTAAQVVGTIGVVTVIGLFSGPLAVMRQVIRDKNTSALPAPFAVASLLNCTLWSCYGVLVLVEPLVWFPNVLGWFSAVAQLALVVYFGGCSKPARRSPRSSPQHADVTPAQRLSSSGEGCAERAGGATPEQTSPSGAAVPQIVVR
eukprot:Hpha_TRINITY_DN49_c0_g1::TRINITY_DN49_c0_g1_i1::g.110158::m.110158/K15382/SLC50A, SWEET; solute carrier family 50 (sugar transporter)